MKYFRDKRSVMLLFKAKPLNTANTKSFLRLNKTNLVPIRHDYFRS